MSEQRAHDGITFVKGHAGGADFVVLLDPEGTVDLDETFVTALCDRRVGVGADGVLCAVRTASVPEGAAVLAEEPEVEWFLSGRYRDGTPVADDGSALRVFAAVLVDVGAVTPERRDTIAIGTTAGVRDALIGASGITADLGRWRLAGEHPVQASGLAVSRPGLAVRIGGLWVATALAEASELDAIDLHSAPATDEELSGGYVFIVPEEPVLHDGVARVRARFYDAVLGEVPSSSAGAAAAALAFRHWGGDGMPDRWSVTSEGGRVAVRMFPTEDGERVSLSGPVELTVSGTWRTASEFASRA